MNTTEGTSSAPNSMSAHFHRRIGRAPLALLAALAVALTVPARAATPPAAIPFYDIGTRATANCQGDALGVTATTDGARLRCGFQKLEGRATSEGLWLESTKPGVAGRLRLSATALFRDRSRARECALTEPDVLELIAPTDVGGYTALATSGKVSVDDKLVRFTRPGLTEEYSVSVDGVRQDFIIESPPLNPQRSTLNPSAGDLRVELALSGARAEATASGARLRLEGSGRTLAYSRLRAVDATGRELPARLEVLSADRLAVSVADAKATYPVRIDPTFSDANWAGLQSGLSGADGYVNAFAADDRGNLYVGGGFSVIGPVFANLVAKWDGSAWSALGAGLTDLPNTSPSVTALAVSGTNLYAAGRFTFAGGQPAASIARWDGSGWSALGSGIPYNDFYNYMAYVTAIAVSGPNVYVGGWFTNAGGVAATNIAKWNGSAWSSLGTGVDYDVHALAVSGNLLYVGGGFTHAGGVLARYLAKWDGSSWSAVAPELGGYYQTVGVSALLASGADLYVGGEFTNAGPVAASNIAKWNGSAWSALGTGIQGPNSYVSALALSGNSLYVGGYFTQAGGVTAYDVAKWDGSTWSALNVGVFGGLGQASVNAVAAVGTNLYVGGFFTEAGAFFKDPGGVPANNIAKWNGSAWSAVSPGMSYVLGPPSLNALAVSGTSLYVGGVLSAAGGVPVSAVAKWDGTAWSALGPGPGGGYGNAPLVDALAVSGTNLFVGGNFDTAGGVPATNIAKWDGNAWSGLGAGVAGGSAAFPWVSALAVSGTNLFAGGSFSTAGGAPAINVARWDGSAWSALGLGLGAGVNALAVSGSGCYAGGSFTTAGGLPANYLAKWNGSAWSAFGPGLNGQVNALAVSGPTLYVAGAFTNALGLAYVAKWDGSTWTALGSGMGPPYNPYFGGAKPGINALAVTGTNLYAVGQFRTVDGVAATNIAKWDGSAWSALGSGVNGSVNALTADLAGRLFVAGNFSIAGTNVCYYIAQANLFPARGVIQSIRLGAGMVTLGFVGLPGTGYVLQRATDVRFNQNLTALLTTNAPSPDGQCCYTDTSPPTTAAFYRLQRH